MKEFLLQGGVLVIAEIQILRHQRRPLFSFQPQSEHSKRAGHGAGFIREVLVPLILPHSQTSVSLYTHPPAAIAAARECAAATTALAAAAAALAADLAVTAAVFAVRRAACAALWGALMAA